MKTVSHGGSELSMYVVNMVGCVTAQEPLLLLVEFVKYGDLLNYLRFVRKVILCNNRNVLSTFIIDHTPFPTPLPPHKSETVLSSLPLCTTIGDGG